MCVTYTTAMPGTDDAVHLGDARVYNEMQTTIWWSRPDGSVEVLPEVQPTMHTAGWSRRWPTRGIRRTVKNYQNYSNNLK